MPKKSPYSSAPIVPAGKIAGTNPIGNVPVGAKASNIVPKRADGMSRGLGMNPPHVFRHHIKRKHGHLRLSGHAGAHQIGGKVSVSPKIPKGQ